MRLPDENVLSRLLRLIKRVLRTGDERQRAHFSAVLRNATPEDVPRIKRFLRRNPSPNVKLRRTAHYESSIANETFYLIEAERWIKVFGGYKVIAVAGVFPIGNEEESDYELGNLYLSKHYRGFGIQNLVMPLGIAATTIFDRTAKIYAGARHGEGAATSKRNIEGAGFVSLPAGHPLLGKPCQTCEARPNPGSPETCCGSFYQLPSARQCEHIQRLLAAPEVITRTRPNGDVLMIEMKAQILRIPGMRSALEGWTVENCGGGA